MTFSDLPFLASWQFSHHKFAIMRRPILATLAAFLATSIIALAEPQPLSGRSSELESLIEQIHDIQLEALGAANTKLKHRGGTPKCHIGNVAIRKE
jgi:hypothetical protein